MPSATVTVREIKNKETGIDITVPTYHETKGLLQSTFEYHVVVVSHLPYFKSPKHKDTDVVQYMVSKKFADFEDLFVKLANKFPATVLPPLPKRALLSNDSVAKERRNNFDSFMKFLACTPKLSTSSVLLEFLGVNAIKAGKYRKDDHSTEKEAKSKEEDVTEDTPTEQAAQSLFDEEDENTDDLFAVDDEDKDIEGFDELRTKVTRQSDEAKLFGDQDLGGAVDEDDADELLFVPGSKEAAKSERLLQLAEDDNSDLLQIEDDLDKFLQVETKPQKKSPTAENHSISSQNKDLNQKPKPSPRAKPSIAKKPSLGTGKPDVKPKPALRQKPPLPNKKPELSARKKELSDPALEVDELDTDNIMKYIEQNTEQDDVDLFS